MGGLASALGSRWVERQKLIRAERTRMYQVLVPQLANAKEHRLTADDLLADLERSAVLAGRQDAKLARELLDAWEQRRNAAATTSREAEERLNRALRLLRAHLDDKLRRRI